MAVTLPKSPPVRPRKPPEPPLDKEALKKKAQELLRRTHRLPVGTPSRQPEPLAPIPVGLSSEEGRRRAQAADVALAEQSRARKVAERQQRQALLTPENAGLWAEQKRAQGVNVPSHLVWPWFLREMETGEPIERQSAFGPERAAIGAAKGFAAAALMPPEQLEFAAPFSRERRAGWAEALAPRTTAEALGGMVGRLGPGLGAFGMEPLTPEELAHPLTAGAFAFPPGLVATKGLQAMRAGLGEPSVMGSLQGARRTLGGLTEAGERSLAEARAMPGGLEAGFARVPKKKALAPAAAQPALEWRVEGWEGQPMSRFAQERLRDFPEGQRVTLRSGKQGVIERAVVPADREAVIVRLDDGDAIRVNTVSLVKPPPPAVAPRPAALAAKPPSRKLPTIEEGDYLYHATPTEKVEAIKKRGLESQTRTRNDYGNRKGEYADEPPLEELLYFEQKPSGEWGGKQPVQLRISADSIPRKVWVDKDVLRPGEMFASSPDYFDIPPEAIEYFDQVKGKWFPISKYAKAPAAPAKAAAPPVAEVAEESAIAAHARRRRELRAAPPTEAVAPRAAEAGAPPAVRPAPPAPVAEAVTAPPQGGARPPVKPPVAGEIPPAEPVLPRPRTLADMNREAKGMRAMTPEQRAAVMDVAKPIEGDILYQARPFNEHAQNLLGPDTPFMKALRSLPGVKQLFGVWNPAAMARDNPVALIGLRQGIFQEIEKARIRFTTLRWWHEADDAFGFKRSGTVYGLRPMRGVWKATKVKPASASVERGKMFGTFNDMIEHPERYAPFTEKQVKVLTLADNTLTQSVRDAQRAGVNVVELAEAYWPRSVIKGPKGEKGFAGIRRRVSGAKGYTHQRAFADVDDLVKAGFEVETDPRRVFASRLEAGIDTIAQANARKQIAALPGVEKPLERMARKFPEVLESATQARVTRDAAKGVMVKVGAKATPEQSLALRQAEANYITSMREVFAKKIEVGAPGYYELRLPSGRIAPQELVEQVGKLIDLPELRQAGVGTAATVTREVSQLLRTTLTNVDLAAGYIQGQTLWYRNNVAWWRAQSNSLVSLIDDPTAWIAKNFDLIDEGVRAGAIVAPTEFLFAKQGIASIPLRIPYIGPGLGSFNRAFEWFITTGQTELYRAARSGAFKSAGMDELVSLGSAIRKEIGTESYAILGVRANQRTMEALSLFAARFFRANIGLLGQSFSRGPGGAEARRAVGSLIAGGTALLVGINWAQNKKLPNMIDPYAPDWMQFRIGNTYFNTFGPFYPYFRTIARMSVSLADGDPLKAATEAKRFLSSKESLPLRGIDIAGQLVYYGSANVYGTKIERNWLSIAKGILSEFVTPISVQEIPSGFVEGRPEAAFEFGGLVGRPVRLASEWRKELQPYFDIPSAKELRIMKEEILGKGLSKADENAQLDALAEKYPFTPDEYREDNPEVDARLFILGEVSSLKPGEAFDIVVRLLKENNLTVKDIMPPEKGESDAKKELRSDLEEAFGVPPEKPPVNVIPTVPNPALQRAREKLRLVPAGAR